MRACVQMALLGLIFGFTTVAYGQDVPTHADVVMDYTVSTGDIINLVKTLGWPLSFAYMFYRTAEKLFNQIANDFSNMNKNLEEIKNVLIKLVNEQK